MIHGLGRHRSNDGSAGLFAVLLPLHSYVCEPTVTRLLSFLFLLEIPRSCHRPQRRDWAKTQVGVVFASYGLIETLWEVLLCRSR